MKICKNCNKEINEIQKGLCRDCFNNQYFSSHYYKTLCLYLKNKFNVVSLNGNVLRQIKEMKESGLNYKQILYIVKYTLEVLEIFDIKYYYTITFCMQRIDEALEYANNAGQDLVSVDKDYFQEQLNKNNEKKIEENQKLEKIKLRVEEEKRIEEERKQKQIKMEEERKQREIEYQNSLATSITEQQLEDYLVDKLHLVEDGLQFIERQYKIERGVIDIFAKDKNDKFCIIELKVDEDDKRLPYQVTYYPSQINDGDCRMITIAPNYSHRIYSALKNINYVEMFKYDIEYGLNKNPIKNLTIQKL